MDHGKDPTIVGIDLLVARRISNGQGVAKGCIARILGVERISVQRHEQCHEPVGNPSLNHGLHRVVYVDDGILVQVNVKDCIVVTPYDWPDDAADALEFLAK